MLGNGQTINPISSRWGGGDPTLKPYALMGFLSSWVHKRFLNMNKSFLKAGTSGFSGSAPFAMNQTDFEGSLNVLEHFYPKRGLLIVVLMGFLKKQKTRQCALISERYWIPSQ